MATNKKSSSIDGKEKPIEENIDDFSEDKLKSLLDEAMDYKSPPDANDKSEMFQQLLKSAKEEEERQNSLFDSDTFFSLKQSNSLQNLQDESYHSQMTSSHQTYSSSKKHHRRSKANNATSVSTRRLEGGSLPVDMHYSLNDQPFVSEWKNSGKKRKEKFKETTVIDMGDSCDDERKLMQRTFDSTNVIAQCQMDDGIEMKSVCYKNSVEMEVEDQRYQRGQPIATILTMRPDAAPTALHRSDPVDQAIQFSSLLEKPTVTQYQHHIDASNSHNNIVVANPGLSRSMDTPVQLNSNYQAVSCLTNDKTASQKGIRSGDVQPTLTPYNMQPMAYTQQSATTQKELKQTKSKKERSRNEIVRIAKEYDGNQGDKQIDELLKFIGDSASEVKGGKSRNSKNGHITSAGDIMHSDEKKKKVSPKSEDKVNKLKKSNSCEELTSAGRQKQQTAGEKEKLSTAAANAEVTLRSKSGVNPSSSAKKGDNKSDQAQSKRNERRSWGNEGLRTEPTAADPQEQMDSSSSCCSHQSETHAESLSAGEPELQIDEFQTVIKKRKVKRKSSEAGDVPRSNVGHLQTYKRDGKFNDATIRPARHNSERDNKNSKTGKSHNQESKVAKSRRKSTSSMPRSDDDESDDNDSVQSLPIETTKTTSSQLLSERKRQQSANNNNNSQQPQNKPATFSYADIAKTSGARNNSGSGSNANGGMTTSIQKWPLISESSVSSHQISSSNNNDPFSLASSAGEPTTTVKHQIQSQQQQHVQKSTASLLTKKLSYPELVESNNNKNKQLSSLSNSDVNGKLAKQLNGGIESFDTNNNTDNQKISYSQLLLDGNDSEFTDTNGNNVASSKADTKTMLTKSKSVDQQNNLTSIDQYPALERTQTVPALKVDKNSKVVMVKAAPQPQQVQQQQQPSPPVKMNDTRQARKLKKSTSCQQSPPTCDNVATPASSAWPAPAAAAPSVASNCRPAVIILNDCVKSNEVDCGFTFGFDINDDLLFGNQTNGEAGADEQTGTCTTDISLETNNNNTCDITNTNLSNNNLNNQITSAESYENFTQTQNNESHGSISGQSSSLSLLSPSQQNQQQNINNVLDTSNDNGYLSSSIITNSANSSPPMPAASNNNSNDTRTMFTDDRSTSERMKQIQVIKIDLPHFRSPDPTKYKNQDELVSFVSDEWTKVLRVGKVFECQ